MTSQEIETVFEGIVDYGQFCLSDFGVVKKINLRGRHRSYLMIKTGDEGRLRETEQAPLVYCPLMCLREWVVIDTQLWLNPVYTTVANEPVTFIASENEKGPATCDAVVYGPKWFEYLKNNYSGSGRYRLQTKRNGADKGKPLWSGSKLDEYLTIVQHLPFSRESQEVVVLEEYNTAFERWVGVKDPREALYGEKVCK